MTLSIYAHMIQMHELNFILFIYKNGKIITQSQLSNILAVYFSINTFDRTDLKIYAHRINMY